MRLFGKKKVMDERERMEIYRIEHYAFWFLFYMLAAGVLFQKIWLDAPFFQYAWELFILFIAAVGTVAAGLKKGHYDSYSEPGWRSYLAYSVIFSTLFTVISLLGGWHKGWLDSVWDVCIAGIVEEIFLFVLLYITLACMGGLAKRRQKKLEDELDS